MARRLLFLVLIPLALAVASCDSANPVAPIGTILTVTITPSQIPLNGTAQVTVVGRKPDGQPLNPGTEIRFTVNLGTIDPIIPVDSLGVATAVFRADSRSGTAMIDVTTGDGSATVSSSVLVGESPDTRPILLLSVNPDDVPVEGTAIVTVIARRSDGTPVAPGQTVILTTTLGSLSPDRPLTQDDGTAEANLDAGRQAGDATITAILGSSDPATTTLIIRDAATAINVQANPSSITATDFTIALTAFVTNSQGIGLQQAPVTFSSQRGSLVSNDVVFTDTSGLARNTLNVTQSDVTGITSFQVSASTPDGNGDLLTFSTTITVQ